MGYEFFAILLLLICVLLLVVEFFVPSGGVIMLLSLVCLAASIYCAWQAWWEESPHWFWLFIGSIVLILPTTIGTTLYILPKTAIGKRLLLEAPTLEEVTPYRAEQERLSAMIGRIGTTITMMSPGGLVRVDGERLHCESRGMVIDSGVDVEVVAVKGNRLVVRPAVAVSDADREDSPFYDEDEEQPPLDFEMPQNA